MKHREPSSGRQPYVKPAFRTMDLLAEEVMAVGCKLPASKGPFAGVGKTCTIPSPCVQVTKVS